MGGMNKRVACCREESKNASLSTTTNMADAYTVSELLTVGRLMPHGPLPRFGEDVDFAVWSMRHVIGAVSQYPLAESYITQL